MKKHILLFLLFISTKLIYSQINYVFTSVAGAFTYNSGPTTIHGSGVDDALSSSIPIGFTFQYGCVNYTNIRVSSNGWLTFNTAYTSSDVFNNLATGSNRPVIAPLWDDLATGSGGNVNYRLTGTAPNRVLTVEWRQMEWRYTASAWAISFQAKLYETSNRIEFVYDRSSGGAGNNLDTPDASIGLSGTTSGDYYSLDGTGASPTASKVTETTTIATKPATGQIYRWDPATCSGPPTVGTPLAQPSFSCGAFTTSLTISGATGLCGGLTYQWQSSTSSSGPFANIGVASSSPNATTLIPASTILYFRCIVACGVATSTSAVISATAAAAAVCTCNQLVTLPYSITGQTTCGAGNDITSSNVTNVCGSASYYTGEDVVYSFVPTSSGPISINLTSTGSSTGLMLYNGCPLSGGTCVGNSQSSSGNKALCVNVVAGQTYYLIIDSYASPACNPYNLTISNPAGIACNMSYTSATTTYNFETFSGTVLPTTDDVLFNTILPFTFPFCFDGNQTWGAYAASNAALVFDALPCYPNIATATNAAPGVGTGFSITAPAPVNATSIPRNAVLAPWHDIHPGLGGVLQYTVLGTAPNRRFILSFENVPMYSCGTGSPSIYHSSQIKLFETTNDIEIHVRQKRVCPGFNNGGAVMGLHNFDGTIYIPPVNATMHNVNVALTYTWVMTNEAYKFTTSCGTGVGTCRTLPIGLKSFYAERIDKINYLYWETATEENLKKYDIERSTDGVNFIEIGQETPNNSPSKYTFLDRNAETGIINYYRICTYENDGKKSYTYIYPLGTSKDEILNVTELFPNPTNSNFTFAFDSKQKGTANVNVFDIYGKLIKSINLNVEVGITEQKIDVSDLNSGIYFVEIENSFKELISKQKLVKIN